jgi:hypothetical protein
MAYVNKENQGRYGVRENYIENTVLVEYNLRVLLYSRMITKYSQTIHTFHHTRRFW